ncbi:hypothetical protein B0H19DRAFT_1257391 [Mycena capillaripes]|nr:hypothetical protein B0H19DRAFT_1257391 [Mycena capillaripes]
MATMSGTSGSSISPSGPSTSPPAQDAPAVPPHKRKYDILVAELGDAPPVGNGKRARRDTILRDTKGPLEKLLSMAKYFPLTFRVVSIRFTTSVSLCTPGHSRAGPDRAVCVRSLASFCFPMLRDTIIPRALRRKLHMRVAVQDGEDASKAPLTPEATAALQALLNGCKLTNEKLALTASNSPSCFYAEGAYDPAKPRQGLLPSQFLLRRASFWTAPASAMDRASKLKKICAARAHGKYIMDAEMLGYVGCQPRTMLSTSAWTIKDGKYDYEKLFNDIVELFQRDPKHPDDVWAAETLAWYQNGVFGCSDVAASDDEDSDDEKDSEVSLILGRRAPRSSTASSDYKSCCYFQKICRPLATLFALPQYRFHYYLSKQLVSVLSISSRCIVINSLISPSTAAPCKIARVSE